MPQNHKQWNFQFCHAKFQAAQNSMIQHLASRSNDKQFAQPLVEDQFRWNAGIDTTQNHGKRLLTRNQRLAAFF